MTIGSKIAIGATAEIFEWERDQVVKLFYNNWNRQNIEYEYNIGKLVSNLGLNLPDVDEIVEYDDRIGIVFEKLEGPTMIEAMMKSPHKTSSFASQ